MDTKRLLVAMAVIAGALAVWMVFFGGQGSSAGETKKQADRRAEKSKESAEGSRGASGRESEKGGRKKGVEGSVPKEAGAEAAKKKEAKIDQRRAPSATIEKRTQKQPGKREVVTRVEGKLYRAEFTSRGGVLRSLVLKDERYREEKRGGSGLTQIDLVRTKRAENLPLKATFHKSAFSIPEPQRWVAVRRKGEGWVEASEDDHLVEVEGGHTFAYRWKDPGGKAEVIKIFEVRPDESYSFSMEIRVKNLSDAVLKERLTISVPSMDFGEKARSFFQPISLKREAICHVNGDVKVRTYSRIRGKKEQGCVGGGCGSCSCRRSQAESNSFAGTVSWGGIDEKYFLLAAAPVGFGETAQCRFGALKVGRGGLMWTDMNFPQQEVEPKKTFVHRFKVYGGPKDVDLLSQVEPRGQEINLGDSVDFGILWFLGKPMVWVMRFFHQYVGNWGIAIILVTILIKLLTLYWNTKSMRSMKQMQKLKPLMDELKQKYGDDKQRYQQEMANLWKRHKINPLGGCLPMLFQMPIYIAWYQALMASVELYRAPLFGWISDLTSPDPYYVMPILMGAAMFMQQRMTPTAPDNPQAKIMMYMMPAMFTFFMLFLPSGLTLYILVNVLLSMLHTWYLNHSQ